MPNDYDDKGRYFKRDSAKDSERSTGTGAASAAVTRSTAGAGLGTAAKSRPKAPQRANFASDEAYSKAYKSYREAMLGDTDTQAQKRALGRMK